MWRAATVDAVLQRPLRPARSSRRDAGVALCSAAAVAVLGALTAGFLDVPLPYVPPLDIAAGLGFALSVSLGPAGAVGAGLGAAALAVFRSGLSVWVPFDGATYALFGYLGYRLWGHLTLGGSPVPPRSARALLEPVAVSALAAATTAGLAAWLGLIAWGAPFHATVFSWLPTLALSAVLASLPVSYALGRAAPGLTVDYASRSRFALTSGLFLGRVVAPVCWLLLGSVLSVAAVLVQRLRPLLAAEGFGWVAAAFDPSLIGPAGRRLQLVVGGAALALLALAYLPATAGGTGSASEPVSTGGEPR
jgi:hypothetical protein